MNIEVKKQGKGHYIADCKDLTGAPRLGVGTSAVMAIVHLMACMIQDKNFSKVPTDSIIVNGRKWKCPTVYFKGRE